MTKRNNADELRPPTIPCPACGKPATGRFCIECGAVVRETACRSCGVALTPGAKFCHDCGTPVAGLVTSERKAARAPGAGAPQVTQSNNLPWILGGLAFVILAVIFAAQRAGDSPVSGAPTSAPVGAQAVDISSMSPQERASRLFDRIMRLTEEGKRDSVELFASMAIPVFESLGPLDLDARYDLGRIAFVSGRLDLARGQADSILALSPSHLLGLILAASVAEARGNAGERAALERRLLGAETAQLATALPEYARHRADIDAALAAAKSRR